MRDVGQENARARGKGAEMSVCDSFKSVSPVLQPLINTWQSKVCATIGHHVLHMAYLCHLFPIFNRLRLSGICTSIQVKDLACPWSEKRLAPFCIYDEQFFFCLVYTSTVVTAFMILYDYSLCIVTYGFSSLRVQNYAFRRVKVKTIDFSLSSHYPFVMQILCRRFYYQHSLSLCQKTYSEFFNYRNCIKEDSCDILCVLRTLKPYLLQNFGMC